MWNIMNYFTEDSVAVKNIFMCMCVNIDPDRFKRNPVWALSPKISIKLYFS